MGHDIRIGAEAILESDDGQGPALRVVQIEREEAPRFDGDEAGRTNRRQPRYSDWDVFCAVTGLRAFFEEATPGLLQGEPGCVRLEPRHLIVIQTALGVYAARHPNARPGFRRGQDETLARILWLEWWAGWAVLHCERPAIAYR
jgi:hypothetical protein